MARPADPNARAALIAAARAEFARRGLRGARVEDITASCGVAKGSFYLHFTSKESLFGELVAAFQDEMDQHFTARSSMLARFTREHGQLSAADVARHSDKYQRLIALEEQQDLAVLESMWRSRDVMGVLMTGSQGTPFEGAVWQIADREVERVGGEFSGEQRKGSCRGDVPAELFGTLIVGTYLLLAQRMCALEQKPDLAAWAHSLQKLVREGSAPARPTPAPRRATAARKTAAKPGSRAQGRSPSHRKPSHRSQP
jgi:AcrR family transcriptional regulator